MSTGRLEAFSDGVIAVAITLLVLDIKVPNPSGHAGLSGALAREWPAYAAYATSFLTIGIIWINHHAAISRLREASHAVLVLNLLLLLWVGVIPFGTSLLATYLRQGHDQHLAAGVYGGILLGMAVTFSALNRHILLVKPEAMRMELPLQERRAMLRRSASGVIPYLIATGLAVLSAYATLIIAAALALFYALPLATR